jgi:predicted ATPase
LKPKRIVITGGPGTGKSSVIKALESYGYPCLHEVSRDVILQARKEGYEQLFLEKPLLFSELLLEGRVNQFHQGLDFKSKAVFYDRGLHDVLAYLHYVDEKYPEEMQIVCKSYTYDLIFILPPWEDIYTPDNERYESFAEAKQIHYYLEGAYNNYNYSPIEVPKCSIKERVAYILEKVSHL